MSSAVNSVPYEQMCSDLGWTHSAVSPKHFIYKPKQRFIQNWLLDELYTPDDYLPITLPEHNNPFEYEVNDLELKQTQKFTQQCVGPPKQNKEDKIAQIISQPYIAENLTEKSRYGRPKKKHEDKILQLKSSRGCPKKQKENINPQLLSHSYLDNDQYSKPKLGRPKKREEEQCTKKHPGRPKQKIDNPLIKMFKCDLCDKTTTTKGNLKVHMHVHTGEKPFKCQHCDRSFASKINVDKHMLAHHILKERCGVKSIKSTHLIKTIGPQKFQCDLCDKTTTSMGNLRVHMRVHTGEKPYGCHHCDRSFTSKINVDRHMLARHAVKERLGVKSIKSTQFSQVSECMARESFVCHLCGCQFTSSDVLNSHVTQCRLMIYGKLIN